MKVGYCLDEIQQIVEVKVENAGTHWLIQEGELKGKKISKDFLYSSKEGAHQEIADRHTRLHAAFKKLDLVACLSINKEPSRKLEGYSLEELNQLASQDKKEYKSWLKNLERSWEEINHEVPDLEKLAKTLRNANLVQKALQNPLAIEFIEIMHKEAQFKKSLANKAKNDNGQPQL